MTPTFGHPWGWASFAPVLCAVHCAATPMLVAVAPALAPGPRTEWALLGLTVIVAAAAFSPARRVHGDVRPFVLAGVGMVAWVASLLHLFHPVPDRITEATAALIVATALVWNSRLHCAAGPRPCSACEREACETATAVEVG